MTIEAEIDELGFLDGLEGDARKERAELIGWLLDKGFTPDAIRANVSPIWVASNHLVGGDDLMSANQICEATGVDLDTLVRLQRALGLPPVEDPDAPQVRRIVSDTAVRYQALLDLGLDEEQTLTMVRVLADGLGRAAEAMRQITLEAMMRPGATELELAKAFELFAQQALPLVCPVIEDLLLLRLIHDFEVESVNAAEREAGAVPGARDVAVAFADLVGFTQLGEALPPEDLEKVANRLAELARDVLQPPVRFVKAIGDAVMLVCPEPEVLLRTLLDLIDAAATDSEFPRLRVGLAFGPAVTRSGDWFGSPVNIASRVTGAARPGSVLVEKSAREAMGSVDGVKWSFPVYRHLRGVGAVELYRARRQES